MIGSCLGHSDHEMIEFSILCEVRWRSAKVVSGSGRQTLNYLECWLGESLGSQSSTAKGSRKAGYFSRRKL